MKTAKTKEIGDVERKGGPFQILLLTVFLDLFAVGLAVPMIPYYAEQCGMSPWMLGLLASTFSAMQMLGSTYMGALSDSKGRKNVLLISMAGSALSYLMLGTASSPLMLFASRIPVGIVKQTLMISEAYVSDLSHPDRRSVWIGRAQAIAAFGYFFGPTVGGFLSKLSMALPAFVASSLFIVDIILVWILLPESLDIESPSVAWKGKKEKEVSSSIWKTLLQRDTLVLFTMQAVFFFSLETLQSVIPYYVKVRFSLEPQENGMMMSVAGMVMVVVKAFLANRVIHRWGEKKVMLGAAVVGASAYVAATQCPSIYVFFGILLLLTSSNGVIMIALTSLFTKSFPRDVIGRMLGIAGSMRGVMGVMAPSVGFYMINTAGPCSPMFVSSTLSITFVVFIAFFLAKNQKRKEP